MNTPRHSFPSPNATRGPLRPATDYPAIRRPTTPGMLTEPRRAARPQPQAIRVSPAERRRKAFLYKLRMWAPDIVATLSLLGALVAWFLLLAMMDPTLGPKLR